MPWMCKRNKMSNSNDSASVLASDKLISNINLSKNGMQANFLFFPFRIMVPLYFDL